MNQKNKNSLYIETLANGLTVIIEPIEGLESVAYEMVMPGGLIYEGENELGASLVLAELSGRGAGELDARQISDAFDALGARHSESAGSDRFSFRGLCLSSSFFSALSLSAKMVLEPTLPAEEIAAIQSLLIQDIQSLPDQPSRRVMHELNASFFPSPYNRSSNGEISGIKSVDRNSLKVLKEKFFSPAGAVLSIAGKVNPSTCMTEVKKIFSSWQGGKLEKVPYKKDNCPGLKHVHYESSQLQIALAYPSAKFCDPEYYSSKVAASILSGGMFGRVFIEVREKRGLVYSVWVRHSATNDYGFMLAYAGTTPERAQETLDVLRAELLGLKGTVTQEELDRAKTTIKSSLVLGEESSSSRAGNNAYDYFLNSRVRPFEEIMAAINSVSSKDIDNFTDRFPAEKIFLTTLGNKELSTGGKVG